MSHPHTLLLHYLGVPVGRALIDPELTELSSLHWGLELPKSTRRVIDRPDLICATLSEDEGLLGMCHPFYQSGGSIRLVIRLSSIAVHHELIPLVLAYPTSPDKESLLCEIRTILNPTQRIVCLNRNRVDLRRANLREITRFMFQDLGE